MGFWETLLSVAVGSGVLALVVRIALAVMKKSALAKNLQIEETLDWAAEFAVFAIEQFGREHGIKGNEKLLGAVEIARERLEKLGVAAGDDEIRRSVGAAYERLKGDLHA